MNKASEISLGYLLADVTRLFRREFDRRVAHLNLTRAQWRALKCIGRDSGLTQAALAEELEMEPIAIGRVIDRLQKAGFVERRADPADRRKWRLHLAPASHEVMRAVDRLSGEMREAVLGAIPAADMAVTERTLNAIKQNLQTLDRGDAGAIPAPRTSTR
ncbi:MarR family winged helix-turn-helix transcriptional regulator [Chiayiivirga flava]|uniref:DNA-binding MarR family transcriptional regulator n=1 Tax=Chiayiivirga flava TaxID=659595 RepID=A0A7W8D8H1_9GAMM|nr:MarR family transcriptional regulator [Chiayiivirga flava]MBB5208727.1 DNA-binding MarR family transcriptional regulator [Chiayiivirga flava]